MAWPARQNIESIHSVIAALSVIDSVVIFMEITCSAIFASHCQLNNRSVSISPTTVFRCDRSRIAWQFEVSTIRRRTMEKWVSDCINVRHHYLERHSWNDSNSRITSELDVSLFFCNWNFSILTTLVTSPFNYDGMNEILLLQKLHCRRVALHTPPNDDPIKLNSIEWRRKTNMEN